VRGGSARVLAGLRGVLERAISVVAVTAGEVLRQKSLGASSVVPILARCIATVGEGHTRALLRGG